MIGVQSVFAGGTSFCIYIADWEAENMRLDARLQAVADFVQPGSRVADIGTDHAYLAISLLREKGAAAVIASDKNAGPCESARHTISEAGMDGRIPVRMGDGLQVLQPGEVDTVCLAGMGGVLMCEIFEAAPEIMEGVHSLVLQPMSAAAELRRWLYKHAWYIADENLVLDDGRIYEIILAQRGQRRLPASLLLDIGPVLWEKKPDLLRHHIESLLFQERRIAAGMEKSKKAKESRKYGSVMKKIKALEARLTW